MAFPRKIHLILGLLLLWAVASIQLKAYADTEDLGNLEHEQASEKEDLSKMKQDLKEIKSDIEEGLGGINKVDTEALKNLQEFHLFCKKASCEIAPGKTIDCLTYNGILPGPIIKVKEGQLVRLIVHNQLDVSTSLYIHGMVLPASVDGLPTAEAGLIKPGQTYAYQFVAKPAGTYWYHPQIMHSDQKTRGLYGAFIVEPASQPDKPADEDIVLVLSDMACTKAAAEPSVSKHSSDTGESLITNPGQAAGESTAEASSDGSHYYVSKHKSPFARSAPAPHESAAQPESASAHPVSSKFVACSPTTAKPHLTLYLLNGKTAPAIPPIDVNENDRVRLRIINCGQESVFFNITGHKLRLLSKSGNLLDKPITCDTITLGVSGRFDLEFTANNPGIWSLGSELLKQSTNEDGKFPGGVACLLRYTNR